MSHEIEQVEGKSFFASAKIPAWHRLGTVVDHTMTASEALETAHLTGWNVRKRPLAAQLNEFDSNGDGPIAVPNYHAVIRDNPVSNELDVLGVVGSQYRPYQNEEMCQFLDDIVDESGAFYETAGSLRDGRTVFVSMKLPNHMVISGEGDTKDRTDFYLTATNSHDGTASLTVMVTPVRVVCANTLQWALNKNKGLIRIRHTGNMQVQLSEVRRDLDLAFDYIDEFTESAFRMIDKRMDEDRIAAMVDEVFQVEAAKSERARAGRQAHAEAVMDLYRTTPTLDGVRNTAWSGLNAVTEYLDHYVSDADPMVLAQKTLFGASADVRQRAANLFAAV